MPSRRMLISDAIEPLREDIKKMRDDMLAMEKRILNEMRGALAKDKQPQWDRPQACPGPRAEITSHEIPPHVVRFLSNTGAPMALVLCANLWWENRVENSGQTIPWAYLRKLHM